MGDTTTVWVTSAEKDAKAVRKVFGWTMDDTLTTEEFENLVTTEFEQVNYGGCEELRKLAFKGIPFTAYSGSGDNYGESLTTAHAGDMAEVCALEEKPACVILDNGKPDPKALGSIRQFLKLRARATKAMAARTRRK